MDRAREAAEKAVDIARNHLGLLSPVEAGNPTYALAVATLAAALVPVLLPPEG